MARSASDAGFSFTSAKDLVDSFATPPSAQAQHMAEKEALLNALDVLGGLSTGTDDRLQFEGDKFTFPARYRGDLNGIHNFLYEYERSQEQETSFIHYFPARPHDGAAAMERALKRLFGAVGAGKTQVSMFGKKPPRRIDVKTSLTTTMSVPWGQIQFTDLEAIFETQATTNDDGQYVFALSVTAPKKNEKRIRALFDLIEDEIKQRSIYRGQAIAIRGDQSEPKFIDLSGVDPSRVLYSADVYRQLAAGLWAPMRFSKELKAQGQTLKTTTLLEGPFGTGKSLAGVLTAQIAVQHGWTYIHVSPGERIESALDLARQYGPAVVWIEDVDTIAGGKQDQNRVVQVLEALDGVTTKVPGGLLVGMTTNYVEQLAPAVLRPGRIDTIVHVAQPDRPAFQGIIKAALPGGQADTLDFDELWAKMGSEWDTTGKLTKEGMLPAFVVGATQDAMRYALARSGGLDPAVTTQDILDAAQSLERTFELQQAAQNAPTPIEPLGAAVREVLERTLEKAVFLDADHDPVAGTYGGQRITFHDDVRQRSSYSPRKLAKVQKYGSE